MSILIVLLTIIFISLIGFSVLKGFGFLPNKGTLFTIACSYGLGVGLVTMQLFLYSRFQIPWQRELILFPWFLFLGGILIVKHKEFRLPRFKKLPLRTWELILLAGIAVTFCYVFFEALLRPVTTWDAWSTWLVESKIFFLDGKVNAEIFNYLQSDYPLLPKLLGSFIYSMLGHVDDTVILLTSFAYYSFLALLFFSTLNKKFGLGYSLLFTFLLMTTQNLVRHGGRIEAGLSDLPLGYYAFVSFLLLLEYREKSKGKSLFLLSIFLGMTMVTKFEGIPLSLLIGFFAALHIFQMKLYKHIPLMFFWFLPFIDWQLFRKLNHVGANYFSGHQIVLSFQKTANAFVGTFKEMVTIKSWNLLWIAYFYSLFIFGAKKIIELKILNFIVVSQLTVYMLMYIFTANNAPNSSIERLLLHIAPLVFYYLAVVTYSTGLNFITKKTK
jgi:hypothetical protein